ncbi:MAG TPA: polysaccharide deacetylase family protein [Longimicrobiales bacterium]|nr:polysaccharide deacetylase family protein [Longimicrobiales bacterium]
MILVYHRIADCTWNPFNTCVAPKNFEEHLTVLRKFGSPATAKAIAQAGIAARQSATRIAVTFDDGYRDNVDVARPILEAHDFPATIFICNNAVLRRIPYYWDEATSILDEQATPPNTSVACGNRHWDMHGDLTVRQKVYVEFCSTLNHSTVAARNDAIVSLRQVAVTREEEANLLLTVDEIVALGADRLLTLGAHTLDHAWLPNESAEAQLYQLQQSRLELEEVVGRPIVEVAYPYGRFDSTTSAAAKLAGYAFAYTTVRHRVRPGVHPMEIPRIVVPNVDGDGFEYFLREMVFGLGGRGGLQWAVNRCIRKARLRLEAQAAF